MNEGDERFFSASSRSTVFISYAWESPSRNDAHSRWVRELAERIANRGHEVILDQSALPAGESITQFMERAIERADVIVVVCTPLLAAKADARQGGVGYEQQIVSAALLANRAVRVIPLLRSGDEDAIPVFLRGRKYVDFRGDFAEAFEELIRTTFSSQSTPRERLPRKRSRRWIGVAALAVLLIVGSVLLWVLHESNSPSPTTSIQVKQLAVPATVAGSVFDRQTLHALPDAIVRIGALETRSDSTGTFRLELPRGGNVSVIVSREGYSPETLTILAPQEALPIALDRSRQ